MSTGFARALVGATVSLLVSVYERNTDSTNGTLVALQGIEVEITDGDGTVIITAGEFEARGVGQYTYRWDTAGLLPGTYKVKFTATVSADGVTVVKNARVELV